MSASKNPLPPLRPELRVLPAATGASGEPTWTIHDPVRNNYIQIDDETYAVLSKWRTCQTLEQLEQSLTDATAGENPREQILKLIDFLHHNQLTVPTSQDAWQRLAQKNASTQSSLAAKVIHGYLFFRIPLFQPQGFLERTLPLADRLASRQFNIALLLIGAAGLYFAMRSWDRFIAGFPQLFTMEGMLLAALAIIVAKVVHELGHAYTAVRYGSCVTTMGVAFMVLMPLLYTDVTDSWRLTDRSKRVRIALAGVRAEGGLAAIALFAWSFLPEGPLKGLMFTVAVASFSTSLFINLNPFMKFDGYHVLSDLVGIDNLQDRSFDVGVWTLREVLFGLRAPCPEDVKPSIVRFLAWYAWSVWAFRFLLYTGLALMVYHLFFKALGIVLFALEIVYFVLKPVWNELKHWWSVRMQILKSRRTLSTSAALAALLVLLLTPWSTNISIPAVVETADLRPVHATEVAQIARVHVAQGEEVAEGQVIATLRSPDIEQKLRLARMKLEHANLRYRRRGIVKDDTEDALVVEKEIAALEAEIRGLLAQSEALVIRSPYAGTVLELNPEIQAGRWVAPAEMIALIGSSGTFLARGFLAEQDIKRVSAGSKGYFYPDVADRAAIPVEVTELSLGAARVLNLAELSSLDTGQIAVNKDDRGRLVPAIAQYGVRMSVSDCSGSCPELAVRGSALVEGTPESLISRIWNRSLGILIRETGF